MERYFWVFMTKTMERQTKKTNLHHTSKSDFDDDEEDVQI